MTKTIINPTILIKIKNLSKCFWFWEDYYIVYSSLLWVSKEDLKRKYPQHLYNKYSVTECILADLYNNWKNDIIKNIVSYFYNLSKPFDKDKNPSYSLALEELKDFRDFMWKDPIKDEIEKLKAHEEIKSKIIKDEIWIEKNKRLENIKNEFIFLNSSEGEKNKQARWFRLEDLFYDVLELELISHSRSYKTSTEQIDGYLKYWSFDYLVEMKWTDDKVKQQDVAIFEWKIKKKWLSTRGIILSISWFDESAISYAEWDHPKMFFIDSVEFINVLLWYTTMFDILHQKEDNLSRFWKVYKR